MTKVNCNEMREVFAGGTETCPFCRKKFTDPNWFLRLLGYKKSAKKQLQYHITLGQCPKKGAVL